MIVINGGRLEAAILIFYCHMLPRMRGIRWFPRYKQQPGELLTPLTKTSTKCNIIFVHSNLIIAHVFHMLSNMMLQMLLNMLLHVLTYVITHVITHDITHVITHDIGCY